MDSTRERKRTELLSARGQLFDMVALVKRDKEQTLGEKLLTTEKLIAVIADFDVALWHVEQAIWRTTQAAQEAEKAWQEQDRLAIVLAGMCHA